MSKKFVVNQAKINATSFSISHLRQNEKRNIVELSLMMPRKGSNISVEDMTQIIYKNYLGILGVTEI